MEESAAIPNPKSKTSEKKHVQNLKPKSVLAELEGKDIK